ncbi:MAG: glycosyltransferase family 2 protein, partial [Desulfuromonadaceae bacterium]
IPVYNSEETIGKLSRALISLLADDYHLEIILVNDYSQDGSDAICREIQAEFSETIVYIKLSRNFGEHNAVMAGLNHARGDYVVTMDDDFQNPPEEVPKLVEECRKGYDVVYCRYGKKQDSLFRNFASWLNSTMAHLILNKPAGLYLSSFKAMNRFLVKEIIKYEGSSPYLDAVILRSTSNFGTIAARHDLRASGNSGYTLKKLASLWGNMIASYSLIPLRILGIIGFVLTVIGVSHLSNTFYREMIPFTEDLSDIEWLTAVSMFFRGFNLLAISIVGEYVGRIYLHINRDPQFVVREVVSMHHDLRSGSPGRKASL